MRMTPQQVDSCEIVRIGGTYIIAKPYLDEMVIWCRSCHYTSYNKNDIEQRYCGNCRVFHDDGGELRQVS